MVFHRYYFTPVIYSGVPTLTGHLYLHAVDLIHYHYYSRDQMMPVLAKLYWLPIRARVSFKSVTTVFKVRQTVFKVRQTGQPSYLAELIEDAVPSRTLRSSASHQCTLKESRTVLRYGTTADFFGRLQLKHGTLYHTMSGWPINSKLSDPV